MGNDSSNNISVRPDFLGAKGKVAVLMAVDKETQVEVLGALADGWQTRMADELAFLTEAEQDEIQRWIDSVRAIIGLIVAGHDMLELNE